MFRSSRAPRPSGLVVMSPLEQLRAGRMPRRIAQLLVGLWLYGASMGLLVRGALGLDPWDVLHVGIGTHVTASLGVITIITGVVALLLWIPLRQWPGLGTVLNTIVIGIALDATLAWLGPQDGWGNRGGLLVAGVVLNGLAGGLYIGSQLGPGPRDGLMTGLARTTGLSLRLVRTTLEITVLAIGWLLGGPVGIGTVLYALAIGPLVQFFLPMVVVPLAPPQRAGRGARSRRDAPVPGVIDSGACERLS